MENTKQTTKNPNRVRGGQTVAKEMAKGAQELKARVQEQTKPRRGQPTKFTQEKWELILEHIATYGDLVEVCSRDDMPSVSTVRRWYRENPELKQDIREAWVEASFLGHSVNVNILRGGVMSTGDFRRDEAIVAENRWHMGKTNRQDFGDKTLVQVETVEPFVLEGWMLPGGIPRVIDGTLSEAPKEPQDDSQ